MAEYFRQNAGIVVFNKTGQVLICERNDISGSWQFPQGGIENGETPKNAALRELKEETSLSSVLHIKTLKNPVRYHFPPNVLESMRSRGFNNAGQDIYWTLVYCKDESEINLQTPAPEFINYRWSTFSEACNIIVDFKKCAYLVAQQEFSPIIANFCASIK